MLYFYYSTTLGNLQRFLWLTGGRIPKVDLEFRHQTENVREEK